MEDIDGQLCASKVVRVGVEDIIQHQGWVNGEPQFYDDIALVRLLEDVKFSGNSYYNQFYCFLLKYFSDYIAPICLPSGPVSMDQKYGLTVSGWGQTETGIIKYIFILINSVLLN